MDVLYVVKADSGHGNRELRWSLRSLAKFGRNLGRVIVAGYPPAWLSGEVERFPLPDEEPSKYRNILRAVLAACERGVVAGEFLYSSDDHFLVKEADLAAVGFYKRRDCIPSELDYARLRPGGTLTEHWRAMVNTRELLLGAGYPAVECNFHFDTRLDAQDWKEARSLLLNDRAPYRHVGPELTCLFQNIRARREGWGAEKFAVAEDSKARLFGDARREKTARLGHLSCGDETFGDPRFIEYMDGLLGEPCRYEGDH